MRTELKPLETFAYAFPKRLLRLKKLLFLPYSMSKTFLFYFLEGPALYKFNEENGRFEEFNPRAEQSKIQTPRIF